MPLICAGPPFMLCEVAKVPLYVQISWHCKVVCTVSTGQSNRPLSAERRVCAAAVQKGGSTWHTVCLKC